VKRAHILVVDDEPGIRSVLRDILEDEDYLVTTAENAAVARKAFAAQRPDLVLLDIWMPDTDGITLLREWVANGLAGLPIIMISGHGTVETAVEAIRLGAYDFLEKPLTTAKLLLTIGHALQEFHLRQENQALRTRTQPVAVVTGKSATMRDLRGALERAAAHDTPVTFTGEPGSGKEVAARYLHACSARAQGPFVTFRFTTPASDALVTQLFGNAEGQPGAIDQAQGGTLFLDEPSAAPAAVQAALLELLESHRYRRAPGGEPLPANVRVMVSCRAGLANAVAQGRLREDLANRLDGLTIAIPTLRTHREDVPDLVSFYANWMVENERLPYRRFTTGAINLLRNHDWPGNVRELRNLVQRVLILAPGDEVTEQDINMAFGAAAQEAVADKPATLPAALYDLPLRDARDHFERDYFEHHLARLDGNVSEVAAFAGVERTHLYRKLKSLGIDPKTKK
jgi:DNA-binding NtrC family response regulator